MNLDNNIDIARIQGSTANFNGAGNGSNHIGAMDVSQGSTLNFGLLNLDNNIDIARIKGSTANFNGAGNGSNHIGAMDASEGSVLNFGLLLI